MIIRAGHLIAGFSFISALSAPAAVNRLSIPVDAKRSLEFVMPAGWRHEIEKKPGDALLTVQLVPSAAPTSGGVLVTPIGPAVSGGPALSSEALRARIESDAGELGPSATPVITALTGAAGFWFTHRDPSAPREVGDFEYMTRVHVGVADVDVTGMVLAHEEQSPLRQACLDMLASAKLVTGAAPTLPVSVAAPGASWSLRFDLPLAFGVTSVQATKVAGGVAVEGGSPDGWKLTAFVEPNPSGKTAVLWRDGMAEHVRGMPAQIAAAGGPEAGKGVKLTDVRTSENGESAQLMYVLSEPGGKNFRSWNIVMVRETKWIDIHLSRGPSDVADQATFDAIAKSVRFAD